MTPGGAQDPDAFVREQVARFSQMRVQAERVKAELAQNTATARSEGIVTITVGAGGVMQSITFGPKADSLGAAKLSTTTMRVYGQACREAAARSQQILAELVGPDSPTLQLMRDAVPPDPEEDQQ